MSKEIKDTVKTDMDFSFGKQNYMVLITGFLFILIGLVLMSGGGAEDPKDYSPAVFDAQRITVAPLIILTGYIAIVVGILLNPKKES